MKLFFTLIASLLFIIPSYATEKEAFTKPSAQVSPATQTNSKQNDKQLSNPNEQQKANITGADTESVGVIATINGAPITLVDILKISGAEESKLPYMFKGRELDDQLRIIRKKALETVIDKKVVYLDFRAKGLKLPIEFKEGYLDSIAQSYSLNDQTDLKELVESRGQDFDEFTKEAFENAAVDALVYDRCYRNVYITPREIYEYYKKHKAEYSTPEQIELQVLEIKRQGSHKSGLISLIETLKRSFKNNSKTEFNDAVYMYSEGPNKDNEGNIGWIPKNKIRKEFLKILQDCKKGHIYGPGQVDGSFVFLRVKDFKKPNDSEFLKVKPEIQEKLTMEKKKAEYKSFINNLKEHCYIKYYI